MSKFYLKNLDHEVPYDKWAGPYPTRLMAENMQVTYKSLLKANTEVIEVKDE
jgi:hypothetical protein